MGEFTPFFTPPHPETKIRKEEGGEGTKEKCLEKYINKNLYYIFLLEIYEYYKKT